MPKSDEPKIDKKYFDLATKIKTLDYGGALNDIQSDLGLSAKVSGAELEALLVYMTNKCYRNDPFKADLALMALGLLNGYNNRGYRSEPSQQKALYAERREKFLKETKYIDIKYGDKVHTYEEAQQTPGKKHKSGTVPFLIETIRSTLDTATTRYLANVLFMLHNKRDCINSCLKAAKYEVQKRVNEKGGEPIKWFNLDYIPEELLPGFSFFKQTSPVGSSEPVDPEPPIPVLPGGGSTPAPAIDESLRLLSTFSQIFDKLRKIKRETIQTLLLLVIAISCVVIAVTSVINLVTKDAPPADEPAATSEFGPSALQSPDIDTAGGSLANNDSANIPD